MSGRFLSAPYWTSSSRIARRNLDPFQVPVIRQETVFNSHAKSSRMHLPDAVLCDAD